MMQLGDEKERIEVREREGRREEKEQREHRMNPKASTITLEKWAAGLPCRVHMDSLLSQLDL